MARVEVAEITARFRHFLRMCRDESLIITRDGKPVAVLMAVEDEEDAKM